MAATISIPPAGTPPLSIPVAVGPNRLAAVLAIPPAPEGIVIFAHGSGSGRFSPRNNQVAQALQRAGFATLLLDLLTPAEEADRANVFDIPLLATRLVEAADWVEMTPALAGLAIGYFGASTGAGAALVAAGRADGRIRAVVSRGGRPDLAGSALGEVKAPTLLLVGSRDEPVIRLNREAEAAMRCPRELTIIPGATHLFEEPGALDEVIRHATRWFARYLPRTAQTSPGRFAFVDRAAAGRALAERLGRFRGENPLILALPRGGVPVACEVAEELDAELQLLLVRKLGAPGHPEVGIGAIVDGAPPQVVLNQAFIRRIGVPPDYVDAEVRRQLKELERRRRLYVGDRPAPRITGRTVIVVDDGVATGGTVIAALHGLATANARRRILAVPVAPRDTLDLLRAECDEVICLASPEPFHAVGAHYAHFEQTSDDEVISLLRRSRERRSQLASQA